MIVDKSILDMLEVDPKEELKIITRMVGEEQAIMVCMLNQLTAQGRVLAALVRGLDDGSVHIRPRIVR